MSHHFDTKLAREDPRLNLCDLYLFDGSSGKTVMAMTVNPDAGLSAPDTLHPEGLYAFRFDLNGEAREEVTFKFKLVNHDTEMAVSILTFSRLWCGWRLMTMLFVAPPERVCLRVKPVQSRLIRTFVRMSGLLQTYSRQMLDSAHL